MASPIKHLRLNNRPNHINPYLTHWTGGYDANKKKFKDEQSSFEILSLIIKGKKLKFGHHNNGYPDSTTEVSSTMICFTDTPIKQSKDHCKRYQHFGISFNKEALIKEGANPVLYIVPNRKIHQLFIATLRVFGRVDNFNNDENNLYAWLPAIMQPYKSNKPESFGFPEYLEREWRIIRILPSTQVTNSILHQGSYKDQFDDKNISCEFENGNETFYLNFDYKIIESIIVPSNYETDAINLMKSNKLKCKLIIIDK